MPPKLGDIPKLGDVAYRCHSHFVASLVQAFFFPKIPIQIQERAWGPLSFRIRLCDAMPVQQTKVQSR